MVASHLHGILREDPTGLRGNSSICGPSCESLQWAQLHRPRGSSPETINYGGRHI